MRCAAFFSRETATLRHVFCFFFFPGLKPWQYTLHCNAESQLESNRAIRLLAPLRKYASRAKKPAFPPKALVCLHCQVLTFTRPLHSGAYHGDLPSVRGFSRERKKIKHRSLSLVVGRRLSVPSPVQRYHVPRNVFSAHPTVLNSARSVTHLSKPIIEGILGLIMPRGML